jgi:hypothetical protein
MVSYREQDVGGGTLFEIFDVQELRTLETYVGGMHVDERPMIPRAENARQEGATWRAKNFLEREEVSW